MRKIRKEKRDKREMRKKEKRKWRGRGKEKERRWGQNILKLHRVTVKIRNRKAKKHCEENVICLNIEWTYERNFNHWIEIIYKYFSWYQFMMLSLTHSIWGIYKNKQELTLNLQCSVLNAVLTTNMWDGPLYLYKAHLIWNIYEIKIHIEY